MRVPTLRFALTMLAVGYPGILALPAHAAPIAKEGDYKVHGCYHGPHNINSAGKDTAAASYALAGMVIADDNSVWHNVSGHCNGAWQLVGGDYSEMGSCDYADPSGDKFFGIYTRKNQDDGEWKVYGGTGKFAGLEMAGKYKIVTEFQQPPGEFVGCSRFWGHWKLK